MRENEFDRVFRDRLTGHSSDVPEAMWRKISGKEKDDRKGFLLRWGYILAPALLAIGGIAYLTFWPSSVIAPRKKSVPNTHRAASVPGPVSATPPSSAATPKSVPGPKSLAAPPTKRSIQPTLSQTDPFTSPVPTRPAQQQQASAYAGKRGNTAIGLASLGVSAQKIIPPPLPKHPSRLDCPILHKKRGDWYLDVYISPDFPFTAQRSGLSYSAGFRLEKTFKGGFSAMAGLQYSRVNLRSYPNDSLYATMADHFDNIDLPLLIGYEYKNADFTIAIHAGIIYNIHSYPGGPHYDPGVHSYIGHTGTSGYLGLDFIKPLNNQLSLFAEPYFRYQPSARSNSSLMTTQMINTAGAMLGIRYNFKKPGQ